MNILNSYDVKVVGVTFENNDGSNRQEIISRLECFDPLFIEYYDYCGSPAYAVSNLDGETIGNLPKELSAEIFNKYPNCHVDGRVNEILGGDDGLNYGCIIHIDILDNNESSDTLLSNSSDISTQVSKNVSDQPKNLSDKSFKIYRWIFTILGIVLFLLGLLLLFVSLVGGILAIIGGVLSILAGQKYKKIMKNGK